MSGPLLQQIMRILHRRALPMHSLLLFLIGLMQFLVHSPSHKCECVRDDGKCEGTGEEIAFPEITEWAVNYGRIGVGVVVVVGEVGERTEGTVWYYRVSFEVELTIARQGAHIVVTAGPTLLPQAKI